MTAAIATTALIFPTGHENSRQVFQYQPATGAAADGLFKSKRGAGIVLVGQPNMETLSIDNPIYIPLASL